MFKWNYANLLQSQIYVFYFLKVCVIGPMFNFLFFREEPHCKGSPIGFTLQNLNQEVPEILIMIQHEMSLLMI